jgi:PIN domain nuclease of toxin-antitoxin system
VTLLLDTHALLWWVTSPERLSTRASREIARADDVLVSPISGWEIASLVRMQRLRLDRSVHEWLHDLLEEDRVRSADVTPSAAVAAGLLGDAFPADPADRLLYATARDLAIPFVSKDDRIRSFAAQTRDVKVVW